MHCNQVANAPSAHFRTFGCPYYDMVTSVPAMGIYIFWSISLSHTLTFNLILLQVLASLHFIAFLRVLNITFITEEWQRQPSSSEPLVDKVAPSLEPFSRQAIGKSEASLEMWRVKVPKRLLPKERWSSRRTLTTRNP